MDQQGIMQWLGSCIRDGGGPKEDPKLLNIIGKRKEKAQVYYFWLDSGEYNNQVIARVCTKLQAELLLGIPRLKKESPTNIWVLLKSKVMHRGQVNYSPLYRYQDSDDSEER